LSPIFDCDFVVAEYEANYYLIVEVHLHYFH